MIIQNGAENPYDAQQDTNQYDHSENDIMPIMESMFRVLECIVNPRQYHCEHKELTDTPTNGDGRVIENLLSK